MNTYEQIVDDLRRLAVKHGDKRVVCLDLEEAPMTINCLEYDDDEFRYYLVNDEDEKRPMTVNTLLEAFEEQDDAEDAPDPDDIEVVVSNGSELYLLDEYEGEIFFEYTLDDEVVVAFRSGDEAELDVF